MLPLNITMRLALMGKHERLSAQRAYDLGLVSELVPRDDADGPGVGDRRDREPNAPLAVRGTRLAIRKSLSLPTYEAELLAENYRMKVAVTEDAQEGAAGVPREARSRLEGALTDRRPSVVRPRAPCVASGARSVWRLSPCPSPNTSTSRTRPSTTARSPGSCSNRPESGTRSTGRCWWS